MREIVLDTETTGLDPFEGHRILEIGCLELKNHIPTGRDFHVYINPEREVPQVAMSVHGLSLEFLQDKPLFKDVVDDFLDFIGDDPLVIHNAKFDMKFLNAELGWISKPLIPFERAIDTLAIARKKFPGSPASLDALCKRFDINLAGRTKHGALIDSELLAEVYLELLGGRQASLSFDEVVVVAETSVMTEASMRKFREPRPSTLSAEEEEAHRNLIDQLTTPLWKASA